MGSNAVPLTGFEPAYVPLEAGCLVHSSHSGLLVTLFIMFTCCLVHGADRHVERPEPAAPVAVPAGCVTGVAPVFAFPCHQIDYHHVPVSGIEPDTTVLSGRHSASEFQRG